MTVPAGWDDIPQELIDGAQALRQTYMALIAVGFTTQEAATIIAQLISANQTGK